MVSKSFVLGLLFILLALIDSKALTHKATEEILVTDGNAFVMNEEHPSTLEKEMFDGVVATVESTKFVARNLVEKKMKGLVDFVEDYSVPRSHPPTRG
ncbi:unnamed protein product [Camellia sinensis]